MKKPPLLIIHLSAASATSRQEGQHYLRQAFALQAKKERIVSHIVNMGLKPVLMGKVSIFDVLTPPGGWDRIHQKHPDFANYSPADQMRIALSE